MKKEFSPKWIESKQPRKQRKYRINAPLHRRQKMLSVHLDKGLRGMYRTRAVPVRVGDEVIITTGEYRKKTGKISKVDLQKLKVYVDSIKTKKVSGQEIEIALDPSNMSITRLKLEDKKREKMLRRKEKKIPTEIKTEKKIPIEKKEEKK